MSTTRIRTFERWLGLLCILVAIVIFSPRNVGEAAYFLVGMLVGAWLRRKF